jgi:hypothetical protein
MAFKLRSHIQGSLPLHNGGQGSFKKNPFRNIKTPLMVTDPVIDPTKKLEEKPTTSEYKEIGRNITTRRGEQDGVAGTFTDTNITERMDYNDEIPIATGGTQTENIPQYLESLKKRFPGVPGSVLIEQGFIGPEFEDQFPLDYDQRDRLETAFVPDPAEPPMENPYQSYAVGNQSAADFGAAGYFGYTKNPQTAMAIVQRGRRTADSGVQPVERLGMSQQQGGTSGLVDKDRRNVQAEEQYVLGLKNADDYRMGLESGKGYVTEMIKKERNALRQKYKGQENRAEYEAELAALKEKARKYFEFARSGQFPTPEMQERFNASHDTIYNKQQPEIDPKLLEGLNRAQQFNAIRKFKGGGRTGVVKPSSVTTHDTRFLDELLK